jgi:hypothetical protein
MKKSLKVFFAHALSISLVLPLVGCVSSESFGVPAPAPNLKLTQKYEVACWDYSLPDPNLLVDPENATGEPVVGYYCQFQMELANPSNAPVDVIGDLCFVAEGRVYDVEQPISGTINPGQAVPVESVLSTDVFGNNKVSEIFIGNCSTVTKLVSGTVNY